MTKLTSSHFLRSVGTPLLAATLLMFCPPGSGRLHAATATEPVGYVVVNCPGSSDTITSLPLSRPPAFRGSGTVTTTVSRTTASNKGTRTATTNGTSSTTISFTGSPFTASQFKYVKGLQSNTYFARLNGGTREGSFFTITDNDASSVTLDLNGDDLSAVTSAVNVSIVPYWTLGTLFPNGQGVTPNSSGTQILTPDTKSVGTNLSPTGAYFYSSGAAVWYNIAETNRPSDRRPILDDLVLYPDNFFTVRNAGSAATSFAVVGSVVTSKLTVPLATNTAGAQDNAVSLMRPVPVTLNDSGLVSSGAFTASSGTGTGDQLLVFDNAAISFNKPPSATYTYVGGVWQKSGSSGDAGSDAVFAPGSGVIIRKAVTTTGATALWVNAPTY